MKRLSKLFSIILVAALVVTLCPTGMEVQAEQFDTVNVDVVDTYAAMDTASSVYTTTIVGTENNQEIEKYAQFTITEDSYVKTSWAFTNNGSSAFYHSSPSVKVYSNAAMTVEKMNNSSSAYDVAFLPAGTYYMKVSDAKLPSWKLDVTAKVTVAAVPVSKLVTVNTQLNSGKTAATVTVNNTLGEMLRDVQVNAGRIESGDLNNRKYWKVKITSNYYSSDHTSTVYAGSTASFEVTDNGEYTIRICDNESNAYLTTFTVAGIDKTTPVVKGVKNKKTYKKAVKIKFSDKDSGIKKATLNGKKIKSGKKVSKKGSYTLKVRDKAGNVKTIKFKIK